MIDALAGHRLARVTLLDCGTFSVRGGERIIGIPAFLLTTDRGAHVLVDGGFPMAHSADPVAAAAADGLGSFGALLDHGPDRTVAAQLALCGVAMADLAAHVLTHGHIDHVGALDLIRCPLILTEIERRDPRPCYFGTARPIAWPDVATLTITGETRLCDGITLIPTPGHTPGHLSLFLEPAGGIPLYLAGDAINRASEPDEGYPDAADPEAARNSGQQILSMAPILNARLIYGHDPDQWARLPKAPRSLT